MVRRYRSLMIARERAGRFRFRWVASAPAEPPPVRSGPVVSPSMFDSFARPWATPDWRSRFV